MVFQAVYNKGGDEIGMDGKRMKAKELVKNLEQKLMELASKMDEAASSEEMLEYLKFSSKFHRYSFHNTLSIWLHCPNASYVAGYKTWQKMKRYVKKGESGIPILAPIKIKENSTEGEESEDNSRLYFRVVYVFDISQTEGEDIPTLTTTVAGENKDLLKVIENVVDDYNIKLLYEPMSETTYGISELGTIRIKEDLDDNSKIATILHELGHELVHSTKDERRERTKQQKETEAECVSYVICSYLGIEQKSNNYLYLYNIEKDDIINTYSRIYETTSDILSRIEKKIFDKVETST